jgi:archaellum component FlaC
MVVGKLTDLERRVESLESNGGGDTRIRNEVEELKNNVRDLVAERDILSQRIMSLEREVRNQASIIDRLENVIWPIPPL